MRDKSSPDVRGETASVLREHRQVHPHTVSKHLEVKLLSVFWESPVSYPVHPVLPFISSRVPSSKTSERKPATLLDLDGDTSIVSSTEPC